MLLGFVLSAFAVVDADGDGFVAGIDCDDSDPDIHPGSAEVCNLADDDCDGFVDEGFDVLWYVDADGDGFGDRDQVQPTLSCDAPAGHVDARDDCDDADPAIHPFAVEVCDARDQDCDHEVNDGIPTVLLQKDRDADGFGAGATWSGCTPDPRDDAWYVLDPDTAAWDLVLQGLVPVAGDCSDFDANIHPGAEDVCDELDNDCNGVVDDSDPHAVMFFADADGDGLGDDGDTVYGCAPPRRGDWVEVGGDCDDADPAVAECPLPEEGCGCGAARTPAGLAVAALGALAGRRRRARPEPRPRGR